MRKQINAVFEAVVPANSDSSKNTGVSAGDYIAIASANVGIGKDHVGAGTIYKCKIVPRNNSNTLTYRQVNADLEEISGLRNMKYFYKDVLEHEILKGNVRVLPTGYEVLSVKDKRETLLDIFSNLGITLSEGKKISEITPIVVYKTIRVVPYNLQESDISKIKIALERRGIITGNWMGDLILI